MNCVNCGYMRSSEVNELLSSENEAITVLKDGMKLQCILFLTVFWIYRTPSLLVIGLTCLIDLIGIRLFFKS